MIFSIFVEYQDLFIDGLKMTLFISLLTVLFGSILGVFICLLKMRKNIFLKAIGTIYVELLRGTPILLQLYIIWFGLQPLGITYPSFPALNINDLMSAGILCLSLNSAAYIAEIYRGGIQSIDKGQSEAALSLGFSKGQTFRLVVFPQAIKNVLPSLGNEFVTLIKESSLLSVLGVGELMYSYKIVSGSTYKVLEVMIIIGILYFFITFTLSSLIKVLEWRFAQNARN